MIDCHFHIWDIDKEYYRWLTPELDVLYRTFSIEDYEKAISTLGIDSAIVVQAADDINESIRLLEISENTSIIQGVIGWVDFESEKVLEDIDTLLKYKKLKGLRPMLQDIEDVNWINNPAFSSIFGAMEERGLIFEALVRQEHLPNIIAIARAHPNLNIVINHGAKPIIDGMLNDSKFKTWMILIREAAACKNIACKLSGLVTECTDEYSKEVLRPYVKTIINSFTPDRVVWGSDWPVVKLKCPYATWLELSKELLRELDVNVDVQKNIFENNARQIYQIEEN